MSDVFDVEGLDELKLFVDRFVSTYYMDAAKAGMTKALLLLHGKIPQYPPPPSAADAERATSQWTDKQRRYFFWALRAGVINVPYRRTGTLGRQVTTDVRTEGADVYGVIGIATPYAPWVVGPDRSEAITLGGVEMFQAPIHQGRWWQFGRIVEANMDEAYAEFVRAAWAEIERAYGEAMQ